MSSGKRLAKRSILGTRVCAQCQDGRFYSGVIQATKTNSHGENVHSILFDDGVTKEFYDNEIIGPGFQSVTSFKLKSNQSVYITYCNREVQGQVIYHRPQIDEVLITVILPDNQVVEVKKKLEEVRLMESRKSARLQDTDTDYSKLLDYGSDSRKRAISHNIDVPISHGSRKRRTSSSDASDSMDDCAAAMVLMSLSCSPKSSRLPRYNGESERISVSPIHISDPFSSSLNSSGTFSWQGHKSEASTPSPPIHRLSESAPVVSTFTFRDEGIEMDEGEDFEETTHKDGGLRTVFQCTWPGCGKILSTCPGIERHVRNTHLGPKQKADSDLSDHEEEFYYTEIEVNMEMMSELFVNTFASSPPTLSHMDMARPPHEDPTYKHTLSTSVPQTTPKPMATPINIPQLQRSLSWHITPQLSPSGSSISPPRSMKLSPKSIYLSSSPKSSPLHKKTRGESKKCRKVYGMENRDLWCTQCKWKKACSRFID